MHIVIEDIVLSELEFRVYPENKDHLEYNIHVTCKNDLFDDNLIQVIQFDLTHGVETPPFDLKFTYTAHYRCEGEGDPSLEDFAKYNGPAYIVPYARELISNLTSRSGLIPTLILPPINIFNLIDSSKDPDSEPTLGLEHDPALTEDQSE